MTKSVETRPSHYPSNRSGRLFLRESFTLENTRPRKSKIQYFSAKYSFQEIFDAPVGIIRSVESTKTIPTDASFQNESEIFVKKLIEIRDSNHIGKSLDYLFQRIYGLLKSKKFEECESLISGIDISKLDEYLMLGLLTATLPWKNRIQQRDGLYDRIEKQLKKSYPPDELAKMMSGLK